MTTDAFPALVKALTTAVAEASASPDPAMRAAWAEAGVRAVLAEQRRIDQAFWRSLLVDGTAGRRLDQQAPTRSALAIDPENDGAPYCPVRVLGAARGEDLLREMLGTYVREETKP